MYQKEPKHNRFSRQMFALGLLCLGLSWGLPACQSGPEGCKYGKPQAVIRPDMPGVKRHEFKLDNEQASTERVQWALPELDVSLELQQSGCEKALQEYIFVLPEALPSNLEPGECAELLADIFAILGQTDPSLQQWLIIARLLGENAAKFRYDEWQSLSQGEDLKFQAKFVRIPDPRMGGVQLSLVMD